MPGLRAFSVESWMEGLGFRAHLGCSIPPMVLELSDLDPKGSSGRTLRSEYGFHSTGVHGILISRLLWMSIPPQSRSEKKKPQSVRSKV